MLLLAISDILLKFFQTTVSKPVRNGTERSLVKNEYVPLSTAISSPGMENVEFEKASKSEETGKTKNVFVCKTNCDVKRNFLFSEPMLKTKVEENKKQNTEAENETLGEPLVDLMEATDVKKAEDECAVKISTGEGQVRSKREENFIRIPPIATLSEITLNELDM